MISCARPTALALLVATVASGCHARAPGTAPQRSGEKCLGWEIPGEGDPGDLAGSAAAFPEGAGGPAPGVDLGDQLPAPGPERPFVVPRIQEARLSNGIRVLLVERRDLPVAAVRVAVDRGVADAAPGVGFLFGAMLRRGTECRIAPAIHSVAWVLGAELGTSAGYDATSVSLRVATPGLGPAIELARDLSLHAALGSVDLGEVKASSVVALAQRSDRPATLAEDALARALYPAGHPYAAPHQGSAEALRAVERRDLLAFRGAYLRPERLTIAVAGDVGRDVIPQMESLFGAWRPDPPGTPWKPAAGPEPAATPRVVVVDDPGAPQSHVAIGCVGAPRGTGDYATLKVLERVLSWALLNSLRQEHGYTYGVGARFVMRREAGPFVAGGPVARAHTADAVRAILAQIDRVRAQEIPPQVLKDAQRQLVNENGALFETAGRTADALLDVAVHGLPLDEYETLPARLRAVTSADVRRAAERYLDPGRMKLVVVGDAATIHQGLAELGWGAPEVQRRSPSTR
jgi:predicted Zn-dependent peptidase